MLNSLNMTWHLSPPFWSIRKSGFLPKPCRYTAGVVTLKNGFNFQFWLRGIAFNGQQMSFLPCANRIKGSPMISTIIGKMLILMTFPEGLIFQKILETLDHNSCLLTGSGCWFFMIIRLYLWLKISFFHQLNHFIIGGHPWIALIIRKDHALFCQRFYLILWHINLPEAFVQTKGFQKFDNFSVSLPGRFPVRNIWQFRIDIYGPLNGF